MSRVKCTCPRYWQTRWYSHHPNCRCEAPRKKLIPYTDEEIAERERRSAKSRRRRPR